MIMPAPVMITTYTRIGHLQRTIEALLKNDLAKETSVFVYVDGPLPGDEEKVSAIISFLAMVSGFAALNVIVRPQNLGAHENAKRANYEVLDKYGSMIRMEDDNVTAPGFLRFMNLALTKYKEDSNVFSITGYCPPIMIPNDYRYDAFFLKRFMGWGCGLWRDRLDDAYHQITSEEFKEFTANKQLSRAFIEGGGKDMLNMLEAVADGRLDAADVVAMYTQFLKDQYTLYPTQSLVQNIGMDATGVHCDDTDYFDVPLSNKTTFSLPDHLVVDPRIVMSNREFWNNRKYKNPQGIFRRVINKLKRESALLWQKLAQ